MIRICYLELGANGNSELIKYTYNNWIYLLLHSCKSFCDMQAATCFLLVDSLYVFDVNPFVTFISEYLTSQLEIFGCLKYFFILNWQVTCHSLALDFIFILFLITFCK